MKAEQVVNFIRRFLAFIVLCVGWLFIFDFFFHKVGEEIHLVDWLLLLAGICIVIQGGLYSYTELKKRKEKENNKES